MVINEKTKNNKYFVMRRHSNDIYFVASRAEILSEIENLEIQFGTYLNGFLSICGSETQREAVELCEILNRWL